MIVLALIALFVAQETEECPASLKLNVESDPARGQQYADCMSRPSLPTKEKLAAQQKLCAASNDRSVERSLAWVDYIATNFPGCETHITISRK